MAFSFVVVAIALFLLLFLPRSVRASNDEIAMEIFGHPSPNSPLTQTVDSRLYQPNGRWIGRLILPAAEDRQEQDWVWIEVYHAPDAERDLVGQTLRLEWSLDPRVQGYLNAVTTEVNFNAKTQQSQQNGNIHPYRLNGRSHVGPLQSLAGARSEDDVLVSLSRVTVVRDGEGLSVVQIEDEPVQITGQFYGLVQILKPEGCLSNSSDLCELFRVRHYNPGSGNFDGPEERVRIPQKFPRHSGILPSTPRDLEDSPAGQLGWYIYGNNNTEGMFVVQALRPRSLFQLHPDHVVLGKTAGIRYIKEQNWQGTKARKGTVQTVLVDPTAQNTEDALAEWKEGDLVPRALRDRALVLHLFGGIGGKKAESMPPGTVTGHFSYGLAEVVREPITGELQFSINYQQVYAHNPDGIIAGTLAWENYMGDLQRGWLGTRPVSDLLIKLDAVTHDYNFDGVVLSPLRELQHQLQIVTARYRTGDGTGSAVVTPATSCSQDSNQALYIAIERIKQQVSSRSAIANWLETHPDDPQTERFNRLVALGRALEAELVPLGVVRSDWKQNAISLAGIETRSEFVSSPTLVPALLSWRTIFPRQAHDEIGRIFWQEGAKLWFLRTNQVGGWDEDIVPLAPTVLLGRVPIVATILSRVLMAVTLLPTMQGWLGVAGITLVYGAIALPLGFASGFLEFTPVSESGKQLAIASIIVFFTPALAEELVYRVLLIPHPTEGVFTVSWLLWAILSLLFFVIYHPLNALWFYRLGYPTFFQPMFLILAGLLGIACTAAYALTGSLLAIALIHWVIVMVWLFVLGGKQKLVLLQD